MTTDDLISSLPGGELLRRGLADFQSNLATVPACLVGIARTRLNRAGLIPDTTSSVISAVEPELQLYRLLRLEKGDAYSRYNALLRELVSFENALDRQKGKIESGK